MSLDIVDEDAIDSAGPRLLDVRAVQIEQAAEDPHGPSRKHGVECFALALRVTVTVPGVLRHHAASGQSRLVNGVDDLQDSGRVGCGKEDGELQAEAASQGLCIVVRMIVKLLCRREDSLPLLRRHVSRVRSRSAHTKPVSGKRRPGAPHPPPTAPCETTIGDGLYCSSCHALTEM